MISEKNIFITGASGFIGRALCKQLYSSKIITGIDLVKKPSCLPEINWIKLDLNDYALLQTNCKQYHPGVAIHCAGIAHQKIGAFDASTYMKVNSEATENLAKVASVNNPKLHFIFLSTISVYGETNLDQPVIEDAANNPSSDYAFSKLDAERRLIQLYEKGFLHKLTILRLAPVYDYKFRLNIERRVFGPKKITYVKFGSGHQTMSALSRSNLVEFVAYLLKRPDDKRNMEIMNVSDAKPYSFYEIIQAVKNSGLYPKKPTVSIPLPAIWAVTRIAGFFIRNQKQWLHSCYEKVASDLVFDNSRMLQTGFKPQHTLNSVFSIENK